MEELFVYAILCSIGYDFNSEYNRTLDKLFLEDQMNNDYLELEGMPQKDGILHTLSMTNTYSLKQNLFGKRLMKELRNIYEQSQLNDFARNMSALYKLLPVSMKCEEPFCVLNYADDCLSYGDEEQCRKLYESAMSYYEEGVFLD